MLTLDSLTAAPDLDRQQRRYNATDAAVTLELQQRHMAAMTPAARQHFSLLMRLHDPLLDMQLRGLRWHTSLARQLEAEAATEYWEAYAKLADAAGVVPPVSDATLLPLLEPYCQKRLWSRVVAGDLACVDAALGSERDRVLRVWTLVSQGYTNLPAAARGELLFLLGQVVNVDSAPALCDWLYTSDSGLRLPPQYNDEGNLTARADALLSLLRKAPDDRRRDAIKAILRLRHLAGRLEVLRAGTDPDGRVRCAYNPVGTVTGRLSCYTSPTGSGFNLQTLTESLRRLVLADDGMLLAQCDLRGADGWTVAAWAAALGDPTMMDDLRTGIKPAQVIVRMLEAGEAVSRLSRDKLAEECKQVAGKDWRYMAAKRVQHGSSYGMGIPTMLKQIVEDSYKKTGEPVFVEHSVCKELQRLFFVRYPGIRRWHSHIERLLQEQGRLTSANGHTRTFYGRKKDVATRNEALAEEPQQNTTHATTLAMLSLWDNHRALITPMHQVHDALLLQFPADRKTEAVAAIRASFQNPLRIAGHDLVIPFEGGIGTSWGELGEKL